MEVGIRKRAWHTCIRYTLLIYDHWGEYTLSKKTRRLVFGVYPRIPPPLIHHWVEGEWIKNRRRSQHSSADDPSTLCTLFVCHTGWATVSATAMTSTGRASVSLTCHWLLVWRRILTILRWWLQWGHVTSGPTISHSSHSPLSTRYCALPVNQSARWVVNCSFKIYLLASLCVGRIGSGPKMDSQTSLTPQQRRVSLYIVCMVNVSQKTVQNCFCQNFIKFPSILITFSRKMTKGLKLCEVHSFSTSSNSCHHTTMLNADVQNCYTTLKVVICNKLSNDLVSTQ